MSFVDAVSHDEEGDFVAELAFEVPVGRQELVEPLALPEPTHVQKDTARQTELLTPRFPLGRRYLAGGSIQSKIDGLSDDRGAMGLGPVAKG